MKIQLTNIDELVPYEKNVKKHDAEQVDRIIKSVKEFGWDQPIVVDADMVIIKGHGRRLAAIKMGLKQVPVLVRSDLSEDQVKAARLADNRVAISDIDTDMFREELASLNYDLSGIFDAKEIDFTMADLGEMIDTSIIEDLNVAIDAQEEATKERVEEVAKKEISVHKALGFKAVPGSAQIHVTRFMAEAEEQTGLKGVDAFIAYCKKVTA